MESTLTHNSIVNVHIQTDWEKKLKDRWSFAKYHLFMMQLTRICVSYCLQDEVTIQISWKCPICQFDLLKNNCLIWEILEKIKYIENNWMIKNTEKWDIVQKNQNGSLKIAPHYYWKVPWFLKKRRYHFTYWNFLYHRFEKVWN